jgi:integrase
MDGYVGRLESVVLALRFLMLTAVRPHKELCLAKWSEIDFQDAVWRIPAGRMKRRLPHTVPLSRQALDVLRRARTLSDGNGFIFPGQTHGRPLSENTLNSALRRLGYKDEQTAHGLRATFSTLANESRLWHRDAIECQLAHLENNKVRAAYMRSDFWDDRVRMAQWYADFLDDLRGAYDPLGLPPEMRDRSRVA